MGGSGCPCLLGLVNPQVLSLGLDFLPGRSLLSLSRPATQSQQALLQGHRHLPRRALLSCCLLLPLDSLKAPQNLPSLPPSSGQLFAASVLSTWGFLSFQVAIVILFPAFLSCQVSVSFHNCYRPKMGWVSSLVLICKTAKC